MPDNTANVFTRIGATRLMPVLTLDSIETAYPLARAILSGGLPVVEIALRSDDAVESIRILRERIPEMLVGAGTVLNVRQLESAHRAGSQFIVTPGFNPAVVEASLKAGLPILPGVNNPTGVEQAMGFGLEAVKFFPAEASGGVPFLEALSGPYPAMRFLPTGGITPENLPDYLVLPNVLACGGTWFANPALVRTFRFDQITRLAAQAVALAARNT